jgi:uncharacterized membrane protein
MLVLAQRLKRGYRPAAAPASQVWSVAGVLAVGVILMFVARFVLKAPFFQLPRESATKDKEA